MQSDKPISDYFYDQATAVFVRRDKPSVVKTINPSVFGEVGYIQYFKDGELNGTADANDITLDMEGFECVKSPVGNLYHAWHVCMCDKCSRVVHDAFVLSRRISGKVWNHSQGTWNDHLRHVDSGRVFTYNTPKG